MISMLLALALSVDTITLTTPEEVGRFVASRSGLLCGYADARSAVQGEIDTEKRRTKIAGVENLARLYRLQERAGQLDDVMAEVRATMGKAGLRPTTCTDPLVKRIAACLSVGFLRSDNSVTSEWSDEGECGSRELRVYRFDGPGRSGA